MATNASIAVKPHQPSRQFTLRQAAVWTVWMSVGLALVSQIGTWWGVALWIVATSAVLGYGVFRNRPAWIATGLAGMGVFVFVFVLLPGVTNPRWAARRSDCQNKLKNIAIALHNYHDAYGCFPPAYIADEKGRPMHSWRVLLLPFLEEEPLYKQYDFSEPWDGPNNSKLAAQMPRAYGCPSDSRSLSRAETSYVAVLGDGTAWPEARATSLSDITDGSSNTILVVESHGAGINWMEPRDLHALQMPRAINAVNGQGICSCHNSSTNDAGRGECANVLIMDGTVKTLPNLTPPNTVDALLTIAGGEKVTFP